jgi:hypothetical protein
MAEQNDGTRLPPSRKQQGGTPQIGKFTMLIDDCKKKVLIEVVCPCANGSRHSSQPRAAAWTVTQVRAANLDGQFPQKLGAREGDTAVWPSFFAKGDREASRQQQCIDREDLKRVAWIREPADVSHSPMAASRRRPISHETDSNLPNRGMTPNKRKRSTARSKHARYFSPAWSAAYGCFRKPCCTPL